MVETVDRTEPFSAAVVIGSKHFSVTNFIKISQLLRPEYKTHEQTLDRQAYIDSQNRSSVFCPAHL